MKPRRVMVVMELETFANIPVIKHNEKYTWGSELKQIQINVVRNEKSKPQKGGVK